MAEPTKKSPNVELDLDRMAGRTDAIRNDRCVRKPIGCGEPATEFRDALSEREFRISGLCQKCQDRLFGGDE
jgi:hypothetical protein